MSDLSISGITGVSDSSALDATSTTTYGSSDLDKTTFLTLLTTQMQNQDPLDPMSNEEFVAQLAQFSSLEELISLGGTMESTYLAISSMNNASMTSLVGQHAVAYGDGIEYAGEGDVTLNYEAAADCESAKLTIYDSEGDIIYSGDAGALSSGEGSLTWDGTDNDGNTVEAGEYTFEITGTDAAGESVDVSEMVVGTIDAMDYSTGTPQPSIDGVAIDLTDIIRLTAEEEA